MAQLMPLPLTVSCFSTIQIGFIFLVPAHPGSPGQRTVNLVCVCAQVALLLSAYDIVFQTCPSMASICAYMCAQAESFSYLPFVNL